MPLQPGSSVGSYKVLAAIGKGGMGEVYRAHDTKLKRDVAIKILPADFARDAQRVSRFRREAELLASLNHPNIAAIHGLEDSDNTHALVLELVEGDTLAEVLKKAGALPVEEALQIARQIAEALEAAHVKGIVHRDLKPANIKVTQDGQVKVLDFGLAKAFESSPADYIGSPLPGEGEGVLSNSPTMTSLAATNAGLILGTAAYMSPEQALGRATDARSDIWAFGVVLYEMLTGKPAFEGSSVIDILGGVTRVDPDWSALPPATPAPIRSLLRRCLQKDRKRRVRDIADARFQIEEALSEPAIVAAPVTGRTYRERILWVAALLIGVIATALSVSYWSTRGADAPEMVLEIMTPPTPTPWSLAISPDGQKTVFSALSGSLRLWLRSLDSATARPLMGTDNAFRPFWSPDSRSIGFFADGKLKRIDVDGGAVQILANASTGQGGTWNSDGVILFTPNTTSPIYRVSARGGEASVVTQLKVPGENGHVIPRFLPDGKHFLYQVWGSAEASGIYSGELDAPETRRLLDADEAVMHAPSGHLLFIRQGTLFAQQFDPVRLTLAGNPFAISDQVVVGLSASDSGPIVYRTAAGNERQFVWLDRTGKELQKIGSPDTANPRDPAMSPDGRRVAMTRNVNGNPDVWILDLGRGLLNRFTSDSASEGQAMWSPDGSRIGFNSSRKGGFDIYQKSATGAGDEELLLSGPQTETQMDWSPDGRLLLYRNNAPDTGFDLWVLPMDGDRKPFPVAKTRFQENLGQLSPDGKWIAFQSDESGRVEIYVQPFPGPGGKLQVSTNGGAQVRWRRDGRELFYIALDDRLMAVPLQFASDGKTVEVGAPVPLFVTRIGGALQATFRQQYIVSPDGQRFLMNTVTEEAGTSPITILLNWKPKQ